MICKNSGVEVNKRKHRKYIVHGMHIIIGDKPFFYLQAMFLVKVQRKKYKP